MKRYPKYKDSGVEWIGEIPKDWNTYKIKQLGRLNTSSVDKKTNENETLVNLVNYMDVYNNPNKEITSAIEFMKVSAKDTQIKNNNVKIGDMLFTPSSETADDIGNSAVVKENLPDTLYSYHLLRLRFDKHIDINFKKYLFNNDFTLNRFSSRARGTTRMILNLSDFKDTNIIIPPLPEQKSISNYLDHKTNQIDTLIEKKQKQIELLKEQRTAIINHAVTKGLKPDVKMKDSGIEWLEKIPAHWKKTCIRYEIMSEKLDHQDGNHGALHPIADDYVEDGIPFIMANNVSDGKLDIMNCKYIPKELSDNLRIGFSVNGDVLLTHKGTIGRVALVENIKTDYIMLTPQVTYYRCINGIYNKFLRYAFEADYFQTQLQIIASKGSTRNYIGLIAQKETFLLFPPIDEQKLVAKKIETNLNPINQTIKEYLQQINLIKEYRTTLISDAVTGKIDVR